LQVGRVKAFGEPAVDRGQEFTSLGELALLLPEAAQACGGTQFQGPGVLVSGDIERMLQTYCHLSHLMFGLFLGE
jgi:hypothetical protein